MSDTSSTFTLGCKPLTEENAVLVREYLDIATNEPENLERTMAILTDDCVWRVTPPGIEFVGKDQLRSFIKMAMGSRTHSARYKVEVRSCFTDGENVCVEYFHGALATRLRIKVVENVCLICHMREGKFDEIHEYVDTSGSMLIGFGLRILPLIAKGRKSKPHIDKQPVDFPTSPLAREDADR